MNVGSFVSVGETRNGTPIKFPPNPNVPFRQSNVPPLDSSTLFVMQITFPSSTGMKIFQESILHTNESSDLSKSRVVNKTRKEENLRIGRIIEWSNPSEPSTQLVLCESCNANFRPFCFFFEITRAG